MRRFFVDFQDRILYGSDLSGGVDDDAELAGEAHATWRADWRYLTGEAVLHSTEFDGAFRGLALPEAVVDKIYRENARRLFPAAWSR